MWPFKPKEIEDDTKDGEVSVEFEFDLEELFKVPESDGESHKTVTTLIKSQRDRYQDLKSQLQDFKTQAINLMDVPVKGGSNE